MKIIITESQFNHLLGLINESYLKGLDDNEIVAATLIGEAGGEGEKGMKAVCNSIKNRSIKKGTSMAGESLRPYQFSMWNDVTSNVSTKQDYSIKKITKVITEKKLHPKWNEALTIAKNPGKDLTKGATHYYAYKGTNKISPPSFTNNWTETISIGDHKFGIA